MGPSDGHKVQRVWSVVDGTGDEEWVGLGWDGMMAQDREEIHAEMQKEKVEWSVVRCST